MFNDQTHRNKALLPTQLLGWVSSILLCVVIGLGAAGCGGETVGTLAVTVRLETPNGQSRSCADFAAEQLRLSFYAESGDQVPYDVATVDCEATASGRAMFGLKVAARTYHRVVLSFVTATGDTARVCTLTGREDAVLEQTEVSVKEGVLEELSFTLVGDSQPCPN